MQHTFFRAEDLAERTIDEWLELVTRLQMLLIFATEQPVRVTMLQGKSSAAVTILGDLRIREPIEILDPVFISEERAAPNWFRMLFSRVQDGERTPGVIARWLELWPVLGPVMSQYCGTLYNRQMFPEQQFLSLAQCLESYHRRRMHLPGVSRNEHERKALRGRLQELLDRFSEPMHVFTFNVRDRLVTNVVSTRNYFTHLNPQEEPNALKGENLYWLCERLSILMQVCLMSELGFVDEEIRERLVRRRTPELVRSLF